MFLEICENVVEINFEGNELNTKELFFGCVVVLIILGRWIKFSRRILIWS